LDLLAMVGGSRDTLPKATWLAKHPELLNRSVAEQQHAWFGQTVYNQAATSRSFIISRLNPR
jgi:hypothetical protein